MRDSPPLPRDLRRHALQHDREGPGGLHGGGVLQHAQRGVSLRPLRAQAPGLRGLRQQAVFNGAPSNGALYLMVHHLMVRCIYKQRRAHSARLLACS